MNKRDQIQSEAAEVILKEKDLILFISMRLGKTRIALKAIEALETVLVVYPNISNKKTWTDEMKAYVPLSNKVTLVTKNSLKNYANKYFDYVIVDEPQLLSLNQLNILKTISYKKRVALTGTLKLSTRKRLSDIVGLNVKYTYDIADAIRDKLVKDYRIIVHMIDLDNITRNVSYSRYGKPVLGSEKDAYGAYSDSMDYFEIKAEQSSDIATRRMSQLGFNKYMGLRTNFLYNSNSLFVAAKELIDGFKDDKILIYTLRQEIADKLSFVSYHTGNKNKEVLEDFKASCTGHLSVVNCVQSGITINNLNKVIFHTCESNTEIFQQKLGRSLLYEYEGEEAEVHIFALKNTQMEVWVNNACKSLEQNKITYLYKGNNYSKVEWIKFNYPDKELYMYNDSICVLVDETQEQFSKYIFIENMGKYIKEYTLSKDRVVKI